jgi:hypothetical protein
MVGLCRQQSKQLLCMSNISMKTPENGILRKKRQNLFPYFSYSFLHGSILLLTHVAGPNASS